MTTKTITNPATEKQVAFLRRLLAERQEAFPDLVADIKAMLNEAREAGTLTTKLASATIDSLLDVKVQQAQPEIGVYVAPDGTIVQAKPNKAGTNVYFKEWATISGWRLTEPGDHVHGEWQYDYDRSLDIKAAVGRGEYRKMTLDEAKHFILVFGRCVRCGRKLKAAESVERGIGPVCVDYFQIGA